MVRRNMRARPDTARYFKMVAFMPIKGLSFGLEYFDHAVFGFGVNLDLGILRCTWYKDVEMMDEDEEEM